MRVMRFFVFLAFCVFLYVFIRLWFYVIDDAFISLRYAQHFAFGQGLTYNIGEYIEGYTNYLWVLFLSFSFILHMDPIIWMKIVNLFLAIGCAWMLYLLGHINIFKENTNFSYIPSILFFLSPSVAISAAEGLETMLFIFLLLLSCLLFLDEKNKYSFPFSSIVLGVLAWTRPDGLLFAPLFFIINFYFHRHRRYIFLHTVLFVYVYGAYFMTRYFYYGYFFPNTFYAKGGGSIELLFKGWSQFLDFFKQYGGFFWISSFLILFSKKLRRFGMLFLAIILIRCIFAIWSGSAWMGHYRFFIPTLPFIYILVAANIMEFTKHFNLCLKWMSVILVSLLILLPAWQRYPIWEISALQYAKGLENAHVAFGKKLSQLTRPDIIIAMDDAGAAPYYANRYNIDMLGLNDTYIAHLQGQFYKKYDNKYVLKKNPDIIVLLSKIRNPKKYNDFLLDSHADMFRNIEFIKRYKHLKDYMFNQSYYLSVYKRMNSAIYLQ